MKNTVFPFASHHVPAEFSFRFRIKLISLSAGLTFDVCEEKIV